MQASNMESNLTIYTALIECAITCDMLEQAEALFNEL
jgi:hypothetical protein